MGYRVDIVANRVDVLEALDRRTYDPVLMDVQMPEMDSLERSRRIVAPGARRGGGEVGLAAGMDDPLTKPSGVEARAHVVALSPARP